MIKFTFLINLIIISLITNSQSLYSCMTSNQVDSIANFVRNYDNHTTNDSILNFQSNVSNVYKLIPLVGQYRVEIQDQYQISVASSLEYYYITQNLTNIDAAADRVGFNSKKNIWLKFSSGLVTITCSLAWQLKINCGTYVQIHFPYSQKVLVKQRIEDLNCIINIAIEHLCAGPYHIWLVYSTRTGSFIKAVYPIFVSFPFCSC